MSRPLAGVRVVEYGNLVAAPYCTMLLADLGADVVKVETREGDLGRAIGPFVDDVSLFFVGVNRGKRSVSIDGSHPEGRHLLWELTRRADVVVNNLRRGAMERLGLGYQELSASNPGLIYCTITAFGSSGPYADRAGVDLIFQGESGMMSVAGGDGDGPQKTATTIGDFLAGTNAALLVSAALADRGATGRGSFVETSLRDGLVAVQGAWNAKYFATGEQPERTGTSSPVSAPNQTFKTSDGYLNLAIVSDRHFHTLCQLLDTPHLASDDRFASNEARFANRAALEEQLIPLLASNTTDHWMKTLAIGGLPVGRILTLPEVYADPQVRHNRMAVEIPHTKLGSVRTQGSPLRGNGEPLLAVEAAPLVGEHTVQLMTELGIAGERLERLMAEGVLYSGESG